MDALNFEAIKVALKQDKNGYVLTLSLHPDEIPEVLLRDWVGARYMVAMVRLNQDEQPMDRQEEFSGDRAVNRAAILCRNPEFWSFLQQDGSIFEESESEAAEWLRGHLGIRSRAELKTNMNARIELEKLEMRFSKWKK